MEDFLPLQSLIYDPFRLQRAKQACPRHICFRGFPQHVKSARELPSFTSVYRGLP